MEVAENPKDRAAAFGLSLLVFGLIILFLFLFKFITPIPPYPPSVYTEIEIDFEGGGGQDGAEGFGSPDITTTAQANVTSTGSTDDVFASNVEEPVVTVKDDKKKDKKKDTPEKSAQQDPKPSQELLDLQALVKNKLKKSSGTNEDNPDGTGKADNGTGPGKGNGDGPGSGNGVGPGSGPGYSLKGRKLLKRPELLDDAGEEGIVVVEIVVDENGKVIDAIPGQRGSTTTSAYLYTLARQAAKTAKFSPSSDGATEQHGTITIVFKLQ